MSIVKDLIIVLVFWYTFLFVTNDSYVTNLCTVLAILLFTFKNINSAQTKPALETSFLTDSIIHDLKVPTIAQLRGLELIRNGVLGNINQEQMELLSQIEDSCKYMLKMFSMVSKAKNLDSKTIKSPDVFRVADVLNECIKELNDVALDKFVEFYYDKREDSALINADRSDIKTLICNFLLSAVSYSKHNEKIDVKMRHKRKQLIFEVTVKSEILSKEECHQMFEKVPQYSAIGYGISLYLTKKIAERYKGKVFAKHQGNDISKFTFTLPVCTGISTGCYV